MITSTITLSFSDPYVEVLGNGLKTSSVVYYEDNPYWVVNAKYNKRRIQRQDTITFTVSPAWFQHEI